MEDLYIPRGVVTAPSFLFPMLHDEDREGAVLDGMLT